MGAILRLRVEGRRGRGGPKLTWKRVIQAYMIACGIDGALARDKKAQKVVIHRPDLDTDGIRA